MISCIVKIHKVDCNKIMLFVFLTELLQYTLKVIVFR